MTALQDLLAFQRETEALAAIAGRLGWDQETVMPRGAAEQRGAGDEQREAREHRRQRYDHLPHRCTTCPDTKRARPAITAERSSALVNVSRKTTPPVATISPTTDQTSPAPRTSPDRAPAEAAARSDG